MGVLRNRNAWLFITTNHGQHPRVIEVRCHKSRMKGSRSLRTVVTSQPLIDEPKRVDLDLRLRYINPFHDPSFSDKPALFRRGRLPLRINNEGFLVVAAREGQLLHRDGRYIRFTNFMNDVVNVRPAVVVIINPKQKKPHLIADVQLARDGSFSLLDGQGRNLGYVGPGDGNPAVIHTNLLDRFPCKGKAIVRIEMKLA